MSDAFVREFAPAGIVLSGGPNSVTEGDTPRAPDAVWTAGVPVLGICYGMQTMAAQLGGASKRGRCASSVTPKCARAGTANCCPGIADQHRRRKGHGLLDVWMSHGDKVTKLPPGFSLMASNEATPIAGMMDESRRFYAVQFHPEVTHTKQGKAILSRFVRDICGCAGDWTMPGYADEAVAKIRAQVGTEEVILGLSGGVDSSVAAALIHRAIGDQLTCIFVDTGLLRQDESAQVMETFGKHLGVRVELVDAARDIPPRTVRRYRSRGQAQDHRPRVRQRVPGRGRAPDECEWLAQGTIYPDVIESAAAKTKKAHTIKSHHNVGGLPDTLHLKLLEPLRDLFKDEVRELGLVLGLPRDMVLSASISRARPRRSHSRRSHARVCRPAAPSPMRSSSTSCVPQAGTIASRRPSPCFFRSVRSA